MKEHEVLIEVDHSQGRLLKIDGKYYVTDKVNTEKIDGVTHLRSATYKQISREKFAKNIDIVVKALAKKTNKEELLRHLLKEQFNYFYINEMANSIKKNKPIKKHLGCVGFKIGKKYYQLVK